MRTILSSIGLVVMMALACAQPFTYQGLLKQSGTPVNGTLSMTFKLYNALTGGSQVGSAITQNVSVQDGLFTVELDFGSVWDGSPRYLEIQVGSTTLTPCVKINPTPYAIWANTAGTANPIGAAGGDLGGTYPNPLVAGLQGRSVANTAPSTGQVLKWNGTAWAPAADLTDQLWQVSGANIFYTAGRVGIGTSGPSVRLSLGGDDANTKLAIWDNGASGLVGFGIGPDQFRIHLASSSNRFSFLNGPAGDEIVTILGNGNVGIGTSGPSVRLSLGGDDANTKLAIWDNGASGLVGFGVAPNQFRIHLATSSNRFSFLDAPAGNEIVTILGNGNVGIGTSSPAYRLHVITGSTFGIFGRSDSTSGTGVYGFANATSGFTNGVIGQTDSTSGTGVYGLATATSGTTYGVYGESRSPFGYAVYSKGNFAVNGNKEFQIDHPLHPETHFLNHFCTEGPDPMNAYSGVVVLDARGEAWVQLPDYFDRINRDPRYILTPVGAPMPNLHVAVKIQNNRFKIAGGVPGGEVSWRVEAIRNDRWVQEYGYQTEQEKSKDAQGKYLNPELYGQPKERSIFYRPEPERPREGEKPQ
jgi:hypothetical protein